MKAASGITRGGGSPGIESLIVSVARRLIDKLNRDDLTSLAAGVVPASIRTETIIAELENPTAPAVRPRVVANGNYRASARGGDLWMRENKALVNAAVAQLQSVSVGSSQAPLKGSLLKSAKKRVELSVMPGSPAAAALPHLSAYFVALGAKDTRGCGPPCTPRTRRPPSGANAS